MVLVATYLLWMYQRVALGQTSEFLRSLGPRVIDLKRIEMATLLPLAVAIVVLGLFRIGARVARSPCRRVPCGGRRNRTMKTPGGWR